MKQIRKLGMLAIMQNETAKIFQEAEKPIYKSLNEIIEEEKTFKNLKELEQKYLELGKEIEALKKQNTEKEEFKYPIYCRGKETNCVVKFESLSEGVYVVQNGFRKVGESTKTFINHTDTNKWQQLEVCKKTGFFDGQLVWCWENHDTHTRILKFYDAKHKGTYQFDGVRCGTRFNNYEPFEGNYPDWALEAFQTLERE